MATLNLMKQYRTVREKSTSLSSITTQRRRLSTSGILLDQIPCKSLESGNGNSNGNGNLNGNSNGNSNSNGNGTAIDVTASTLLATPPPPPPLISSSSSSSSSLSQYSADLSSPSLGSLPSLSVGPFSPLFSGEKRATAPLTATDLKSLCKFEWILCYHSALCLYHTGRYSSALKVGPFVAHFELLYSLDVQVQSYKICTCPSEKKS